MKKNKTRYFCWLLFLWGLIGLFPGNPIYSYNSMEDDILLAQQEIKYLMHKTEYRQLTDLLLRWRFDLSAKEKKQALILLLREYKSYKLLKKMTGYPKIVNMGDPDEGAKGTITLWQNISLEGGRAAWAIEKLLHIDLMPIGAQGRSEREKSDYHKIAYRAVVGTMERPFDPVLPKLSDQERLILALGKETPKYVLEELAKDPLESVQAAARQTLVNLKENDSNKKKKHNLFTEGGRAGWAIEKLVHCPVPVCYAKTEDEKWLYFQNVCETLIAAMEMPYDPYLSKMTLEERLKLARDDKTPKHIFKELAQDPNLEVKLALAENNHVRVQTLSLIPESTDVKLKAALKKRFSVPGIFQADSEKEIFYYSKLADDATKEVAKLMEAPDEKTMNSLVQEWRFKHKGLNTQLLNKLLSEQELIGTGKSLKEFKLHPNNKKPPIQLPGQVTEPKKPKEPLPTGLNWLVILLVILGIIVIGVFTFWLWQRRKTPTAI